jgi:hypothetical protein
MNYLPGLALNHDPPDLCLLSSEGYRCEPPAPSLSVFSLTSVPEQFILKLLWWSTAMWNPHSKKEEK